MSSNNAAGDVTVLILSCDRYKDTWDAVTASFARFWSDCPYAVRLVTNHLAYEANGIRALPVGDDLDWSNNLLVALDSIETPRVLLWLDDVFIGEKVRTSEVERVVAWAAARDAAFIRMRPIPEPESWDADGFGELGPDASYRVSVFATLWKVDTLRTVARRGENPWQFEFNGTDRARVLGGFYATRNPVFRHVHGIEKGLWLREAVAFVHAMGGTIDLAYRPQMTRAQDARYRFRVFKGQVLDLFPERHRKSILQAADATYRALGLR